METFGGVTCKGFGVDCKDHYTAIRVYLNLSWVDLIFGVFQIRLPPLKVHWCLKVLFLDALNDFLFFGWEFASVSSCRRDDNIRQDLISYFDSSLLTIHDSLGSSSSS